MRWHVIHNDEGVIHKFSEENAARWEATRFTSDDPKLYSTIENLDNGMRGIRRWSEKKITWTHKRAYSTRSYSSQWRKKCRNK